MTGLSLVFILISFSILYVLQVMYNRSMPLKVVVITYLFMISSGIYFTFDSYKGWSTPETLESGYMVSTMTVEPEKDYAGAIYYWAVPSSVSSGFFTYDAPPSAPRAYVIPYSKQAAQEFANAAEKLKEGYLVKISRNSIEKQKQAGEEGVGEAGKDDVVASGEQKDYDVPHLEIISPEDVLRKAAQ